MHWYSGRRTEAARVINWWLISDDNVQNTNNENWNTRTKGHLINSDQGWRNVCSMAFVVVSVKVVRADIVFSYRTVFCRSGNSHSYIIVVGVTSSVVPHRPRPVRIPMVISNSFRWQSNWTLPIIVSGISVGPQSRLYHAESRRKFVLHEVHTFEY